MLQLFIFAWCIRTIKSILFWLYLWQLKEYHIPRFIDHFRTHKGKQIFFNALYGLKIVAMALLAKGFSLAAFLMLLLLYSAEAALFLRSVVTGRYLRPKSTLKTVLLSAVSLFGFLAVAGVLTVFVGSYGTFAKAAVLLDILTPFLVTGVVLGIQPFFVLARMRILEKAARKLRNHKNLLVIGITGSYGKTSTKEFLTTILSAKHNVIATSEHKNSEIGIAQTILEDVKPGHEIFIVEMGAYRKGGIKLLCDIVKPGIGMVTGVNEQHLALFGSLENLLSAEGGRELAAALPGDGWLAVNGENRHCVDLYKKIAGRKKINTEHKGKIDADIWAEEVEVEKEGISFIVHYFQKEMLHISAGVLGRQQVQNLLGAILVARELDMGLEQIANACKRITQEQGGMTLKTGAHGLQVIDSSYSSNPDGVMADLDYVSVFPGKRVIVMPCLIELGLMSEKIHYEIGQKIAQVCDIAIITTRDQFEKMKKGALAGGMKENQILLCDKPQEIFHHITTMCKEGDTVLLEGRVPGEVIKLLKV